MGERLVRRIYEPVQLGRDDGGTTSLPQIAKKRSIKIYLIRGDTPSFFGRERPVCYTFVRSASYNANMDICEVISPMMNGIESEDGVTEAQIDAVRAMDGVRFAGCFNAEEKLHAK